MPRPTSPRAPASGFSLPELTLALLLLGVLLGLAAPSVRGLLDQSAVVAAREALVGMVGEARVQALAHGGATLTLRSAPASVVLSVSGDSLAGLALGERFGVELALSRRREEVGLRFDGLGLGRVSSETIRLTRNGHERGVVLSASGRVRRR